MTAVSQPAALAERLLLRGQAIGLCARLLSEESGLGETVGELRKMLDRLGVASAGLDIEALPGAAGGAGSSRPLLKGDLPPYETSYERGTGSAGGPTFQMADIAGFYRAFGFEVSGERPDHIVPELEFVALTLVKEAYARMAGDLDGAEVCAAARRKFVAEHLNNWLRILGERAREIEGGERLSGLLRTILSLTGTED